MGAPSPRRLTRYHSPTRFDALSACRTRFGVARLSRRRGVELFLGDSVSVFDSARNGQEKHTSRASNTLACAGNRCP